MSNPLKGLDPMGRVYWLAEKAGCPVEERDSSATWNFDGKTIAAFQSTNIYDDNFEEVVGKRIERYLPHDLLHEVAHYCVAAPEQRDLPEFGCSVGIVNSFAMGPLGGEFRDKNGILRNWTWRYGGLVDHLEQEIQECAAQMMCWHIGWFLSIPMDLLNCESYYTDQYQIIKIRERNLSEPKLIQAIRRKAIEGMKFLRECCRKKKSR